ncbi:MAG: proton extrusion protein PcxA [Leptolyngbyaceae cyanobacterium SL_7_1]|nr:proton extrusion protein PcxA [Leptolyngbyaceae cyanobacterium SL_7_1]
MSSSPNSRNNLFNTLKGYAQAANDWFLRTPNRALDDAYEAALMIRSIEETHFGGNRIAPNYGTYSKSVESYFQSELNKYLTTIKIRLAEFKTSKSILQLSNRSVAIDRPITEIDLSQDSQPNTISITNRSSLILRKLKVIDEVLIRYGVVKLPPSLAVASESGQLNQNGTSINSIKIQSPKIQSPSTGVKPTTTDSVKAALQAGKVSPRADDIESIVDKTGVLPRSILRTVDRIKREFDPDAEDEVVESFRSSRARTIISLRLILLLLVVPLITQQLVKITLVGPLVDRIRDDKQSQIFLNPEMEEEALMRLGQFQERLEFRQLIGYDNPLTTEEKEAQLAAEAQRIAAEFHQRSNDSVKNVFADIFSVAAFVILFRFSKREIAVLKSFIDELVYGLSDSAKAFIIILLTDIFVGFHSPHGWEVLLEGVSRHLGLPANRDFIFLFIATFPVILDTIFKYWIFRYLNRISPSAVATYRNMNE